MNVYYHERKFERHAYSGLHSQYFYMYVALSGIAGIGMFTARAFAAGQEVLRVIKPGYFAPARPYQEMRALGYTHADILQVGPDAFIPPLGGPDDFTNHCCEPNCGLRAWPDGFAMIALRDIAAGEELTYDYSTHQEHPLEDMDCRCGAPSCRGVVRSFSRLPKALQKRYLDLDVVADFAADAALAATVAADV